MARIVRLSPVESIKAGEPPDIAPDGTILNPERYHACDVELDDGVIVQVERPLTMAAIREAYRAASGDQGVEVDGISVGDNVESGRP